MSIKTRTSGIMVDINVEPAATTGWAGVTSGLTHHWPMDDANNSGNDNADIVGGLTATANGAGITSAVGPSGAGTARQTDGSSFMTLASAPIADLTATCSVCMWVYVPDVTDGGLDGTPFFNNFHDSVNATGFWYTAGVSPVLWGTGNVTANEPGREAPSQRLPNATWTMISFTYPGGGSDNTLLYLNSNVDSGNATGQSAALLAQNFFRRNAGSRQMPNGVRIGRTTIYNRVLSGAEILQNVNAQ